MDSALRSNVCDLRDGFFRQCGAFIYSRPTKTRTQTRNVKRTSSVERFPEWCSQVSVSPSENVENGPTAIRTKMPNAISSADSRYPLRSKLLNEATMTMTVCTLGRRSRSKIPNEISRQNLFTRTARRALHPARCAHWGCGAPGRNSKRNL